MFTLLGEREKPVSPPDIFTTEKTTTKLKNQIMGIIHEKYICDHGFGRLCISEYSHEVLMTYNIAKGKESIPVGETYNRKYLFDLLYKLSDRDFFELLDCLFYVLEKYKRLGRINVMEYDYFIYDINEVLMKNGIGYQIKDGGLLKFDEPIVFSEIINPCFIKLKEHGLNEVNDCLIGSFEKYKSFEYKEAIMCASNALEALLSKILHKNKIAFDPKIRFPEKIRLLKNVLPSQMSEHFENIMKIIQTPVSIRGEIAAHWKGDNKDESALAKYVIDTICSDILLLTRVFYD